MLVLGWPISAWPILVSGWPIFVSAWLLGFCLADLGFGLTDLGFCLTHLDASKQCFQLSWNISTKSLLEKPFFSCLSNLFGQPQEEPVESHRHFLQFQLLQLSFEHFLVFKWPIPVIKVFILSHKILYLSTKFSCRPMADSISSLSLWHSSADMAFVSSVWQSDWGSIPCPLNKSAQSHSPRKSLQLVKTKTPHSSQNVSSKHWFNTMVRMIQTNTMTQILSISELFNVFLYSFMHQTTPSTRSKITRCNPKGSVDANVSSS